MVVLRKYQKVASSKLTRLCQIKKCAYLSGECRTGKTMVALSVVKKYGIRESVGDYQEKGNPKHKK